MYSEDNDEILLCSSHHQIRYILTPCRHHTTRKAACSYIEDLLQLLVGYRLTMCLLCPGLCRLVVVYKCLFIRLYASIITLGAMFEEVRLHSSTIIRMSWYDKLFRCTVIRVPIGWRNRTASSDTYNRTLMSAPSYRACCSSIYSHQHASQVVVYTDETSFHIPSVMSPYVRQTYRNRDICNKWGYRRSIRFDENQPKRVLPSFTPE